jgi:hypothetical protein
MKQSVMNIYIYKSNGLKRQKAAASKTAMGQRTGPGPPERWRQETALGRRQDARALKCSKDEVKGTSELSLTATDRPHANLKGTSARHQQGAVAGRNSSKVQPLEENSSEVQQQKQSERQLAEARSDGRKTPMEPSAHHTAQLVR